ncbi:SymE family type I addiction module toxin [Pectobacterium cacticida]|uniref:SymE family type I addiction module toxin n=1 Tax=Pectobacterium cacticida TaxID=69221 RepID=UPI00398735DE
MSVLDNSTLRIVCKIPTSAINLKDRWLEESGFMTGMPITITVEWGRLIIEMEINL